MSNRKLASITAVLVVSAFSSLMATLVYAAAENPGHIRKQYGGKQNTPDHLMFTFLLRAMTLRYESDKDFALEIVQDRMRLDSRETAQLFLDRMLASGQSYARTKRVVDTAILCQDNLGRAKSEIYRSMDSLDDARITISEFAYRDFVKTLSTEETDNLKAWIDDAKEGYTFTALDHSSLYENRGVDVKTHVEQLCIKYEQEELTREQ